MTLKHKINPAYSGTSTISCPHSNYIRLTTLPKGVIIYIDVGSDIYELNMIEDCRAKVCSAREPFNEKSVPCTIIGCIDSDGTIFADCIYHGTQLLISAPRRRHITAKIKTASIRGDGWYYEFWTDLNQ